MIDRDALIRSMDDWQLADWVIFERQQELAIVDEAAPATHRSERRTRWDVVIHEDSTSGRGSAHVTIDGAAGDPATIIVQAVALARASIGPAWSSSPPAAPARVDLADPGLVERELDTAAAAVVRTLRRPSATAVHAAVRVLRETVNVTSRAGIHAHWLATEIRARALVIADDRSLEVTRDARQLVDLDFDAALASATADLALAATAAAPRAGACAVVLGPEAMLHGGLGVWAAFASQADAVVERQGLTRYKEHAVIAPGADQILEPLDLESDGSLAFGVRSAPLGDEGDAVRRFKLVDHGIAAGLGLSPREAALRRRDPNGGVRNLVVSSGSWSGVAEATRVIEVRRLRDLAIDPYTGEASLELALAVDLPSGKAFTGGTIRLDLISALAHARRSAARIRRGAYEGPSSLLIERAELVA